MTYRQLSRRKSIPSEMKIRRHWAPLLWDKKGFDSEDEMMELGICFACGFTNMDSSTLDRSHITPRCYGGSDTEENIHMLCKLCHKDSEGMAKLGDQSRYWKWFYERSGLDRFVSEATRSGVNIWKIIKDSYEGR